MFKRWNLYLKITKQGTAKAKAQGSLRVIPEGQINNTEEQG